jgi:hypothetical protein
MLTNTGGARLPSSTVPVSHSLWFLLQPQFSWQWLKYKNGHIDTSISKFHYFCLKFYAFYNISSAVKYKSLNVGVHLTV